MTERRVSVRLVGVGGDQLKSLLTELGDEGQRALGSIARAAGPASATLQEVDRAAQAAGVEMKGLYERTALASAVMRAAAIGAAEVSVRIEAAGLAGRKFKTAADEATTYGRVLDNLRATYNPLYAATREYNSTVEDIRQAHVAGALSVEEMTRALDRERIAYQQSVVAIQTRQAALDAAMAASRGPTTLQRIDALTGVTGGVARDAADIEAYGRSMDDLRAKANPLYATIRRYKDTLADLRQAHRLGAISADELTEAIQRERRAAMASIDVLKGRATYLAEVSTGANVATYRMNNLAFQINDIGVSLAGGMNPFVVMAQQGTQIAQIYGFGRGGVNALMRDLSDMARTSGRAVLGIATRFPFVTAAVGAATLGILGMQEAINDTAAVHVTFGEVAVATWQTLVERVYQLGKPMFDTIASWWETAVTWADWAWEKIVDGAIWMGDLLIKAWKVQAATVVAVYQAIPDAVGALALSAVNRVIDAINWMIEKALNGINALVDAANWALSKAGLPGDLERFDPAVFRVSNVDNPYSADLGARRAAYAAQVRGIMQGSPLGEFFDDVTDRAMQMALNRPDEPGSGGGSSSGGTDAGQAIAQAADLAARGWAAVAEALSTYSSKARDWGSAVGAALVGAFQSAESAFRSFIETGKVNWADLATSIISDLAMIAARQHILGPASAALGFILGPRTGNTGTLGLPAFAGGGYTGNGPRAGGLDGRGGFLAMLHPQEDVVDRTRRGGYGAPVYITIQAQDVESFRRSRVQVARDLQRAVSIGRRGM